MAQPFDYLCVLDFEATCEDGADVDPQEIIEFPIVLLNTHTLQVEDEFHCYVRPEAHPQLSPFCTQLTGIQQGWVDAGSSFPDVLRQVDEWLRTRQLSLKDDGQSFSFAFVTCGDWDLKTMLPKQCALSGVARPDHFSAWINVKRPFEKHTGDDHGAHGMGSMLAKLGLSLDGRHHSGIDDARNIAKIAGSLMRGGCVLDFTRGRIPGYVHFHHPSRQQGAPSAPAGLPPATPSPVPPAARRRKQRLQNGGTMGVGPAFAKVGQPPPDPRPPPPQAPPDAPARRYVVHCMKAPWDVYIGRPNPQVKVAAEQCVWGNPFTIGHDGTRSEVIQKYRDWLLRQPALMEKARQELRGKVLGCWCSPQTCHGDLLSSIANEQNAAVSDPQHSPAAAEEVAGSLETIQVLGIDVPRLANAVVDIGLNLSHRSFANAIPDVVQRAALANCQHMVLTGTSLKVTRAALQLAQQYPSRMTCTAGVHPHDAKNAEPNLVALLATLLESGGSLIVAVGECGLDFRRNFSPPDVQERVFEDQVRFAVERRLPLFCHESEAHERFLDVLQRCNADFSKVCVHCFTGTEAQLQTYVALGCYVGITGFLCHPTRGLSLRAFLSKHLPLSRLMVETDAPFMHPLRSKGRNEPCLLPLVVQTVASCYGVSLEEVARVTTANAQHFFRLPQA